MTGASSGMGEATAKRLLEDGFAVAGVDLDPLRIQDERAVWVHADVRSPEELADGLARVAQLPGAVDVLVNAAGIYPTSDLSTLTVQAYRDVMDTNVLGTLLAVQATVPLMADDGAIVNFASIDAFVAPDHQLVYSASKAAVVGLTRALARELAGRRIRVNAVAPGWVASEANTASGRLEAAVASIPLGRAADPREMAELVTWLATGEGARYITGETVVASGGLVTR